MDSDGGSVHGMVRSTHPLLCSGNLPLDKDCFDERMWLVTPLHYYLASW